MEHVEIITGVDEGLLRRWLSYIRLPMLVEPSFFENMGFPAWFVRQYFREHYKVLQMDGELRHKIRGINEIDFLKGLAEAIGANTAEAAGITSKWEQTRLLANACLTKLDQIYSMEKIKE